MTGPAGFEEAATAKQFDDIDRELARLALLCKVSLLQDSVIQRVLHDDASACGTDNPVAFRKMRELLMMHYVMRQRAMEELGGPEAQAIIDLVVGRIRERFAKLGLAPPP
jgi:hypothetical protein